MCLNTTGCALLCQRTATSNGPGVYSNGPEETMQAALWVFMSALSSSPGTQGLLLSTGPTQIMSVNGHR